jgi:hypothetical protein
MRSIPSSSTLYHINLLAYRFLTHAPASALRGTDPRGAAAVCCAVALGRYVYGSPGMDRTAS